MIDVEVGQRVRHYGEDDWFYEGTVIELDGDRVRVDYDDYIQEYPSSAFGECWEFFERIIVCTCEGVRVKEYA